jgi:hypothetical protein
MDTLLFALNAILPIILLIFLGYFLNRIRFLDEDWFKKGNKLIFRVCLPVLLYVNVYNIESFTDINWSVVIYAEIAIFVIFFLGILLVKLTIPDDRQKGVVLQCTFRSNFAIIGLTLAEALGGVEGRGIAAVLSAFSIPTFNVLAVIALTMFRKDEGGKKISFKDVLLKIAKNPLIIGVVLGLITLGIRSLIPREADGTLAFSLSGSIPFLFKAVTNLSKVSSPLALIILGGLFDFSAVKGMLRQILIATLSRVAVVPFLCIGTAVLLSRYTGLLNFDSSVYPALLALFGSPVAVASAIMAQEMDNDGVLAGQLVVWTSVMSIFSLFFGILILRGLGLL